MDSDIKLCLNKMCRVCLSVSTSLIPLSKPIACNRTLYDALLSITNSSNNIISDQIPEQICSDCESMLCQSDNFKKRCIESDEKLATWVKSYAKTVSSYFDIKNEHLSIKLDIKPIESSYECADCLLKFTKAEELFQHCINGHEPTYEIELEPTDHCNFNDLSEDVKKDLKEEFYDEIDDNYMLVSCDTVNEENSNNSDSKVDICLVCDLCKLKFDNKNLFKAHVDAHKILSESKQKNVLRKKVKKKSKCDSKLIKNGTQDLDCGLCRLNFKSLKALTAHWRKYHITEQSNTLTNKCRKYDSSDLVEEEFQCSLCMRRFIKKESLQLHIKKHEERDKETVACKICKREFKHQAHLDNHIESVHTKQKTIEKQIIEVNNMKQPKRHSCKTCGKSFQMLSTLKDHTRVHTGEKPFLCSTCGRGFSQKTNLKEHMRRHQGLKPFPCETCDRRFVSKGELIAHTRKHTGAHPFVCDTCNMGFTTSSSLVKHRRTHTGEKPFACDFCPMRFAASSTLKNHRRTHTGEKPYHCAHCDKAFVQRNDLVSHTRCHTGERPYICSICGQAFRQGSALKTHLKIHNLNPIINSVSS